MNYLKALTLQLHKKQIRRGEGDAPLPRLLCIARVNMGLLNPVQTDLFPLDQEFLMEKPVEQVEEARVKRRGLLYICRAPSG